MNVDGVPKESFNPDGLGSEAWVLATGEEAGLITAVQAGSDRLDSVTKQIFQGLVTSADPVYILEDRGRRGANQVVYSRASDAELELEPALLHPLASGADVGRYAFGPLRQLLLFPYHRVDAEMQLVPADRLADLPLTNTYVRQHEDRLRDRERKKMDHDGWYGYVYPKNLAAHDKQKLAVPRLCDRLHASADAPGGVYLDNVDVGGVLVGATGPSIWTLLVLLNSRLLDWVFRRYSVPFRGAFWSANKQFIAPLPIRVPSDSTDTEQIDQLGLRLHERSQSIAKERGSFLAWLAGRLGTDPAKLKGSRVLASYHERSLAELLQVLERNKGQLPSDVGSRTFREELDKELTASLDRIGDAQSGIAADENTAEDAVFELYGLTARQRLLVASEFASTTAATKG